MRHLSRRARRWALILGVAAVTVPTLAHSHGKPAVPSAKSGGTIYEVREGDTLSGIAKRFRVSLQALIDANGLERPDLLRTGQRLLIPSGAAPGGGPGKVTTRPPARFVLGVPDVDGEAPAFRWPLEGPISSPFGRRRNGWHAGIDIRADGGTPVVSAASGTVVYSGWEKLYGRVVKIAHDNGFMTVYAHNLKNIVETGEVVEAGQVIATVGRSGRASTYHLHFEIRMEGKVFNPVFLLPARELEYVTDGEDQPVRDDQGL